MTFAFNALYVSVWSTAVLAAPGAIVLFVFAGLAFARDPTPPAHPPRNGSRPPGGRRDPQRLSAARISDRDTEPGLPAGRPGVRAPYAEARTPTPQCSATALPWLSRGHPKACGSPPRQPPLRTMRNRARAERPPPSAHKDIDITGAAHTI
jgi:hypothetical protein